MPDLQRKLVRFFGGAQRLRRFALIDERVRQPRQRVDERPRVTHLAEESRRIAAGLAGFGDHRVAPLRNTPAPLGRAAAAGVTELLREGTSNLVMFLREVVHAGDTEQGRDPCVDHHALRRLLFAEHLDTARERCERFVEARQPDLEVCDLPREPAGCSHVAKLLV